MRRPHFFRRDWRKSRNSKRRADLLKRLHIGEQLEVRAAPGSMIVDALALSGHPMAMAALASRAANEPQQPNADGTQASSNKAARVARQQESSELEGRSNAVPQDARAERPARTSEPEYRAAPRDPAATAREKMADTHRDKRSNRTCCGPVVFGFEHSGWHRAG